MPRYRKRPIEVTADQWFPGKDIPGLHVDHRNNEAAIVITIQGVVVPVAPGEWVIQEGDGVHAYPCDPTEFERIYEPVPAEPDAEIEAMLDKAHGRPLDEAQIERMLKKAKGELPVGEQAASLSQAERWATEDAKGNMP